MSAPRKTTISETLQVTGLEKDSIATDLPLGITTVDEAFVWTHTPHSPQSLEEMRALNREQTLRDLERFIIRSR